MLLVLLGIGCRWAEVIKSQLAEDLLSDLFVKKKKKEGSADIFFYTLAYMIKTLLVKIE